MAHNIKKMLETYSPEPPKLSKGHKARFESKLDTAFSGNIQETDNGVSWMKIAAIAVIFLAVSFFGYQQLTKTDSFPADGNQNSVVETAPENTESANSPKLTLADISPDLKIVEEYYMTGINVQLASLKITEENRDVVEGYMQRLAELDREYNNLNAELSKVGPTEATVTALIDNLRLRLDLLFKLKNKLKELKTQDNETFKAIQT